MGETLAVSCWWGRRNADPSTIHCTQNGMAKQVWGRNRRGKWVMTAMELRPVVELTRTEFGVWQPTFGPARRVL